MGPSVGKTSASTRSRTSTFVRLARFSPRRACWSMMARHFSIRLKHAIAAALKAQSCPKAPLRRIERCAEPGAARHPPQPQDRRSVARPAPLGAQPKQSHWCNHLGLPALARRIARLAFIRHLAPSRGSLEDVMANSFAKRRYAAQRGWSAAIAVVALVVARRKRRSVGRCRTVIAVQRGLCPNALPLETGPAARRFCYVGIRLTGNL